MKLIMKRIVAYVLALLLSFSCVSVFATDDTEGVTVKYSDFIKHIAKELALFGRYENIFEQNLYLIALDALIKENPELYNTAVEAMINSIDENSDYFKNDEAKKFIENLDDEIEGIGVTVLERNGNVVVSQPIPGSPADKAGIKSGDIIIAADDIVLTGMSLDDAIEYIRGKEGASVKITILRSGMDAPINVTIIREKVMSQSVDYELLERDGKKIALITVYSFTKNVAAQFKDVLDKIDAEGIKKIIMDLRDNGGGYFDQVVAIADMLLPADKLITTEDHKVDALDYKYVSTGIGREYEIVILINGMTASASEVLTAALVENGAAVAVGTNSFGKGTVQTMKFIGKSAYAEKAVEALVGVPDDALMKYTTAFYLTPNGNNIHQKGIVPNAVVENTSEPIDMSQFSTFAFSKKYTLGDRGDEVKNAKKLLSVLGLYFGEINDLYDENMRVAVATFQEAMKLYSYGVLDFTTQTQLYEKVKSLKIEQDDQLEAAIDSLY